MFLDGVRVVRFVAIAVLLTAGSLSNAQEPPNPTPLPANSAPDAAPTAVKPAPETVATTPGPPATEPIKSNPCDDTPELSKWIDKVHSSLYRYSCSTVSWFDGLFGSRPFENEYQKTNGTVTVGGKWSRRERVDKTLRFRARVYFPQISNQFNAFVGRADRTDVVNETQTDLYELPTQFTSSGEESVFMGLGFNERMKKRGSFDLDAGVRIDNPLDPYVRGSYRFTRPVGEHDLLRFREMLFWQQREGFGTTTLIEWNHVFDERNILRWSNSGTFSEHTIGMRWYSDVFLYHLVSSDRAFAYQVFSTGSTRAEVPLTDYGAAVIFRQRVWRKWLVLELRGGIDWPRNFAAEERKPNPNGALVFEMRFGRE